MLRLFALSLMALGLLALSACGEDPERENPPCQSDADCTLPQRCAADGLCRAPDPVDAGEPCLHPDHCESKLCLDTGGGGVCSVACAEPSECKADQVCAPSAARSVPPDKQARLRLVCQDAGSGEAHLNEACTSDDECRSRICDEQGRCTRPCDATGTDGQACPGALICEETTLTAGSGSGSLTTGVCRRKLLEVQELGPVDVPKTGMPAPVTFTVAEDVTSFLLFADDTDNLHVVIKKLEAPDGTIFVNFDDRAKELARAYDRTGTATVQVPGTDNPKGAVQAGTYKAWIQTYKWVKDKMEPEAGKLERVALLTRRSKQKGGLIDLNLHFTPATGVKAAKAKDDAFVKASLAELSALYNRLMGVGPGQVRYFDLPASEDTVKSWDHVGQVRTQYSKEGPNKLSVNVFVVKKISMGYTGLAGGIPGVPGLAGRPVSGVVVEKQFDGKKMGRMLAHEIGHFLGLYHTTESQKGPFKTDLISDTPVCPSGTQAEKCPDFHNVMFPFYYKAPDPLVLSRGQATVARGSPFLYELAYPEACGAGTDPVADVTASGFASGTTAPCTARLQSSCGGAGQPERVHLYRLAATGLKSLEVQAVSGDFDPVVYVLSGSCRSGDGTEVGCQSAKKGAAAKVTIDAPQAGAYYIVVDSDTGTGDYRLTVRELE